MVVPGSPLARAAALPASAAKRMISRYPGKLPAYRWRLAVLRAHRLPGLARYERAEAASAIRSWGRRPVASVAVVIPTYRRPEQLVEAVRSVLAQTWTDLVVIVVDDGAGLPPLPADDRLFAYSLSRNCGVAGVVRNVGIRASASRFLAFLDDDNVWLPHHLEVAMAAHAAGDELTYSALERRLGDGSAKDVWSVPFDRNRMRNHAMADTNTIVVQRGPHVRFSRVPLHHGDFPLEDWELVYRLSRTRRTRHLEVATARYLVHDGSFFTNWNAADAQERRERPAPAGSGAPGRAGQAGQAGDEAGG